MKEVKKKAKAIIETVQRNERELIEQIEEQIEKNNSRTAKGQCVLDQTRSTKKYVNQVIEKSLPASQMKGIRDTGLCMTGQVIDLPIHDDSKLVFVASQEYTELIKAGIGRVIHKANAIEVSKSENVKEKKNTFAVVKKACSIYPKDENKIYRRYAEEDCKSENKIYSGYPEEDCKTENETYSRYQTGKKKNRKKKRNKMSIFLSEERMPFEADHVL
jgi:hypothetical protein